MRRSGAGSTFARRFNDVVRVWVNGIVRLVCCTSQLFRAASKRMSGFWSPSTKPHPGALKSRSMPNSHGDGVKPGSIVPSDLVYVPLTERNDMISLNNPLIAEGVLRVVSCCTCGCCLPPVGTREGGRGGVLISLRNLLLLYSFTRSTVPEKFCSRLF